MSAIAVENPATGEVITTVPVAGAAELAAVVSRARSAADISLGKLLTGPQ